MTTKEYLEQYTRCKRRILRERENLLRITEAIDSVSIDYSGMPHGSDTTSKQERYIVDLEALFEKKSAMINQWTETMLEVKKVVLAVEDPLCSALLYHRYISDMPWDEVAEALAYSVTYVKGTLHSYALNHAKKVLDSTPKYL